MKEKNEYRIPVIERKFPNKDKIRLIIGIPMTGLLRSEWVLARYGQVIPCNWGSIDIIAYMDQYSPLRFTVADARNIIVQEVINRDAEWCWFIDHDVIIPPLTSVIMNDYMIDAKYPIVSGLYFAKGVPAEPLVYRGHCDGHYRGWHFGDRVWVSGHGMGCTLIHGSILKAVYKESEPYQIQGRELRRVFTTPTTMFHDPETNNYVVATGTEDLEFLWKLQEKEFLAKAGWPKFQKKKYPYIVDTNIFCRHIDFDGKIYPSMGEEQRFIRIVKK